jgi:ribosome biogenesis GTPase
MTQLNATLIKGIGGFYYAEASGDIFECRARGAFRKEKITPLVGDRVVITVDDKNGNTVDEILERRNFFSRPAVANIDKLMIVMSVAEPGPNLLVTDKLTVIAEYKKAEPVIIINKTDLKDPSDIISVYKKSGIKTVSVCAQTGQGTDELASLIEGCICAFTGNTGVGKSSLLNCLSEDLGLKTGEISRSLGRGRHTTRETVLLPVCGGYAVDTPGFGTVENDPDCMILKEDLQYYFPEFQPYLGKCRFPEDCSHIKDKGCAIVKAVEDGYISESRHESYRLLYEEAKKLKEWQM